MTFPLSACPDHSAVARMLVPVFAASGIPCDRQPAVAVASVRERLARSLDLLVRPGDWGAVRRGKLLQFQGAWCLDCGEAGALAIEIMPAREGRAVILASGPCGEDGGAAWRCLPGRGLIGQVFDPATRGLPLSKSQVDALLTHTHGLREANALLLALAESERLDRHVSCSMAPVDTSYADAVIWAAAGEAHGRIAALAQTIAGRVRDLVATACDGNDLRPEIREHAHAAMRWLNMGFPGLKSAMRTADGEDRTQRMRTRMATHMASRPTNLPLSRPGQVSPAMGRTKPADRRAEAVAPRAA